MWLELKIEACRLREQEAAVETKLMPDTHFVEKLLPFQLCKKILR